eukprot:CAMPEP_0172626370 /NCGR_PEP_ID=MMETSP1068-20121228/149913_1 /TAXON_ID=35684 /ORGANISM="Pseudopedinella elastica, Strain CCMP716" /LENGTH=97 /DNA_ID=CAMNT_0013435969 /DNA_START=14 /DNA_END=303 /DNA_ORIENTATION=-
MSMPNPYHRGPPYGTGRAPPHPSSHASGENFYRPYPDREGYPEYPDQTYYPDYPDYPDYPEYPPYSDQYYPPPEHHYSGGREYPPEDYWVHQSHGWG